MKILEVAATEMELHFQFIFCFQKADLRTIKFLMEVINFH